MSDVFASPAPRLYSIDSGESFVDALVAGLRGALGDAPEALAGATLLLPTRRACRALRDAFLRASGGAPLLLPRMMPLGDVDEEELVIGAAAEMAGGGLDLPPAIPETKRRLLLTRLILASDDGGTPDQAARLAAELGTFLDQVQTEGLDFSRLHDLVPEEFASHWSKTLDFLKILTEHWPAILESEGALDPAERRNRLLDAQAEAWTRQPPETPVIAAGATGTIPAVARLLDVVARLPRGAMVLPGLDFAADPATWDAVDETHPQHGLKQLLAHLALGREDVLPWPESVSRHPATRTRLIQDALRPAATTDGWRDAAEPEAHALRGVSRIDCPGPQEEAGVIALIMRQALEEPGRTAALVTPDRALARRVASELARWGIEVDDSAGIPLAATPPGAFLRLSARMVAEDLAPVSLLAALKHPLAAAGRAPAAFRAEVRRLETKVLRGPRPAPGLDGLRAAGADPVLVEALERAIAPLAATLARDEVALADLVTAHVALAETLAATDAKPGDQVLWAGEAGETLAGFVAELFEAAEALGPIPGRHYPALLEALMSGRVVRPRWGRHPRLHVWGLLEARLQRADVTILGGLDEGIWPPLAQASPWMSRPMLRKFGLPAPERRIGAAAHDFVQAFCAPLVYLTRAERVEGTPTVPSRWLLRLDTLVENTDLKEAMKGEPNWLHWQDGLDWPETFEDVRRPEPRPPVSARPRGMYVTQVEAWMRDPYAVYARHILGLRALDPLDADPGAADYGNFIHKALETFAEAYPRGELPGDALERLLEMGRDAFGAFLDRPGIWAFWWPRFERVAAWFVAQERARRAEVDTIAVEVTGALAFDAPAGTFTVKAKADRIERLADGSIRVIDYKTGIPPSPKEVEAGFAPQLPLEAAIAEAGGFDAVGPGGVAALEFWRLRGTEPAGEIKGAGKSAPEDLARRAIEGLKSLVAAFDFEEVPYLPRPRPEFAPKYSDFEHLARVREWSAAGEEDGE